MFHGPGQPRKVMRGSNEDLWTLEEERPLSDSILGPELVSRTASTLGAGDPESQLLRLSRGDALPSIYRRRSEAAVTSSTPSSSPLLGDTQQLTTRRSVNSRDSTPHGVAFAKRAASNCSSGDEGPPRSERQWSTPHAIDMTAPPMSGNPEAVDEQPAYSALYHARFFQDHKECPLLPIDGRSNQIVLMRPGFFSIRLESNSDALTIAKLEIDGAMTRCNFRLMPHQKHTVRETRLDVGQHAVPLTFDPSDAQVLPIETDEDIEMHVGCVRILFFEAYERAATLKWEWDPMNPAEIVCFDYGMLDAFVAAFPALQTLDAVHDKEVDAAARKQRRKLTASSGAGAMQRSKPSDEASSAGGRPSTVPSVGPSRRALEAHGRHVERSMRLKSSNAVNQTNTAHSTTTKPSVGVHTTSASRTTSREESTASYPGAPAQSRARQSIVVHPAEQGDARGNGGLVHGRSMENPLLQLDLVSRRGVSQDSNPSAARPEDDTPQHQHNHQQQQRPAVYAPAESATNPDACCHRCRPLFDAERTHASNVVAQLQIELERANRRIAVLEQQGGSGGGSRSRSPQDGLGVSHRTSGVTRDSERQQKLAHHRPAAADNTASRLRQQRFAPHAEVHIDPASSGRWDPKPTQHAHTTRHERHSSSRSRSTSPTIAALNEAAVRPAGQPLDSGDRILQFAHKIIAEERRLRHHAAGDDAPQDRLWA